MENGRRRVPKKPPGSGSHVQSNDQSGASSDLQNGSEGRVDKQARPEGLIAPTRRSSTGQKQVEVTIGT